MKKNTVRIAWFGVFTALALIFSYVETLIPFQIGIPGVKLGLANLIVVVALYKMGGKDAMLLSVTRIVAMLVVETFSVAYYVPVLLIAGVITGFIIGVVANEMLKRLGSIVLS